MMTASIICVLGSQWGDEGKGKLVDILSRNSKCCARYNGGANAGHTIRLGEKSLAFHLLPCGMLHEKTKNFIGNGVVVHLRTLFSEIDSLTKELGRESLNLLISSRCHLTFDFHILADETNEQFPSAIGTTKRGIGQSYATKALRIGLRGVDCLSDFHEFERKFLIAANFVKQAYQLHSYDAQTELREIRPLIDRLKPMIVDCVSFWKALDLFTAIAKPNSMISDYDLDAERTLVIEGANAVMLDLDLGTYPYCTSSSTNVCGAGPGLGIPLTRLNPTLIGVAKAYCTRVGKGGFPTELKDEVGSLLQQRGREFGTSTGRRRRCGWFDVPMLKYSTFVNGYHAIMITKLDILDTLPLIKVATRYLDSSGKPIDDYTYPADANELENIKCEFEEFEGWNQDIQNIRNFDKLPFAAQKYICRLEELVGVPIVYIGVGPHREAVIYRPPVCVLRTATTPSGTNFAEYLAIPYDLSTR